MKIQIHPILWTLLAKATGAKAIAKMVLDTTTTNIIIKKAITKRNYYRVPNLQTSTCQLRTL